MSLSRFAQITNYCGSNQYQVINDISYLSTYLDVDARGGTLNTIEGGWRVANMGPDEVNLCK